MVYLFGAIGFVVGFIAGQVLLLRLLRGRSNREILTDSSIRWIYGALNWFLAGAGAWLGTALHGHYFGG